MDLPETLAGKKLHREGGGFYLGENPGSPTVGDIRVSHEAAMPGEVSVIAAQVGDGLGPYTAKAGGTIEIGSSGCPNHPIESGKATAVQAKSKTNYIEVAGSLTFPLVSSASAFTIPMRRGVVKALAAQCGANVDDVELSVANVTSSGGRRRVLLGVGGVVVT